MGAVAEFESIIARTCHSPAELGLVSAVIMRMLEVRTSGWLEGARRGAVVLLAFAVLLALGPAAAAGPAGTSGASSPAACCDQPTPVSCAEVASACAVVCAANPPGPGDHPQFGAFVPVIADCRSALVIAPWSAPQRRPNGQAPRAGPPSYLRFARLLL